MCHHLREHIPGDITVNSTPGMSYNMVCVLQQSWHSLWVVKLETLRITLKPPSACLNFFPTYCVKWGMCSIQFAMSTLILISGLGQTWAGDTVLAGYIWNKQMQFECAELTSQFLIACNVFDISLTSQDEAVCESQRTRLHHPFTWDDLSTEMSAMGVATGEHAITKS